MGSSRNSSGSICDWPRNTNCASATGRSTASSRSLRARSRRVLSLLQSRSSLRVEWYIVALIIAELILALSTDPLAPGLMRSRAGPSRRVRISSLSGARLPMIEPVAHFEIGYTRCLDPAGKTVAAASRIRARSREAVKLYRALSARARSMPRLSLCSARAGSAPLPPRWGRRRCRSARPTPCSRPTCWCRASASMARSSWRGVTPLELFLYWGGDERGSDFAGPREDFPDLRAGRQPCAACGRRRARLQAAARAARRRLHVRRRRDLERRCRRSAQHRRRLAPAGRVRRQQQSMGYFGAARAANRGRRPWRKRPSPPACRASRSTATMSSRSDASSAPRSSAPAAARGRR